MALSTSNVAIWQGIVDTPTQPQNMYMLSAFCSVIKKYLIVADQSSGNNNNPHILTFNPDFLENADVAVCLFKSASISFIDLIALFSARKTKMVVSYFFGFYIVKMMVYFCFTIYVNVLFYL